jgi:diguanylate cyclase (GGDEF)-like protein
VVGAPGLRQGRGHADPPEVTDAARRGPRPARTEPAGSPYDAGAALDGMLGRLRATLGATRVSVWVHEASTGMAVPFAKVGCATAPEVDDPRVRAPLDLRRTAFLSTVIRERRAVVAHADDPGLIGAELISFGVRSVHAEPLFTDGEVSGVLVVDPAPAASPALLRQAAPRIAVALSAAAVRRSEQRRMDHAEVLLELIERAAKASSTEHLLADACQQLAALGEAERACVFLLEDGRLVPTMARYADGRRRLDSWEVFRTVPEPLRLAEAVLREGRSLTADSDSDLLAGWWVDTFGIGSALAVPLGHEPSFSGVLTLDSPGLRPFPEDVRRLAAAAGAHLGSVVEQARASEARAASLRTAQAVQQVLAEGARATGVADAAEVLARALRGLLGTERSAAYLVGDDGLLTDVRHVGHAEEHQRQVRARLVGRDATDIPLWRAVAEQRSAVFVEDALASDLIAADLVAALGLTAYVCVPLFAGERLLGAVVTGSTGARPTWAPEIREAVRQVTLEGALVVENAALRAVEQLRLEQLATEAHHDPLTGLANRRRFIEQLEATVYAPGAGPCAVLMIDLDRFKEINDSFGHSVGDDLLCLVGPRLQQALAPGDLLARMGGDEFAALLPGADSGRADDVAVRLGAALREAFVLDGMPLHVDASIGIALCPDHGRDRSLLLARADTAMYAAKRGRNGAQVWAPDGATDPRNRLETLEQLRAALDTEQLVPHYQPKLDLRTGAVIGAEALVRWEHPHRALLFPDVFLPLAEQAGLMRRLALRVLERSLSDLAGWRARGHDLTVAVNLSVSNLQDVALPDQVSMLLDAFAVPAGALVLEITEDVLMADAARSQLVMAALRRLGVRLSVDDYGTGYSSLAYLRALPVDELKLDRSFVSHLTSDEKSAAIVRSTLQLSRDLGMTMVVEGVEDAASLAALQEWGCDVAQGYHIARPMPGDQFLEWLDARPEVHPRPLLAGRADGER